MGISRVFCNPVHRTWRNVPTLIPDRQARREGHKPQGQGRVCAVHVNLQGCNAALYHLQLTVSIGCAIINKRFLTSQRHVSFVLACKWCLWCGRMVLVLLGGADNIAIIVQQHAGVHRQLAHVGL